ncbi:glycosyltransferase 87 family protein [Salinibacterium sp. PAMC 21357]|uniref:glycosyltransferase 87 family protein n=1 Tax=Salinibacterium sp. PAMC 21357 TaxID=1112215 RepID=UPI000289E8C9|nr:glycosyltransferase 87 family protein [Salinibacterium sp. PAMC 21357]
MTTTAVTSTFETTRAMAAPSALTLALVFIAVHLTLGLLNLFAPGLPLGDVTIVYARWAEQAYSSGAVVGIDTSWVYPLLALAPILAAVTFGLEHIAATWLSLVMVLNVVALGFLTRWGRSRRGVIVGWWWAAFLLALGPIALARIDSITVALAIIGVRLLRAHPQTAGVVLACATWIKVWPAALMFAAVIALRDRGKIAVAGIATTAAVVVFAVLAGAHGNVFSFITEQTGRGIQIESPVAGIWLWQIVAGVADTAIYYDTEILTFQVAGSGVAVAAAVLTPLLAVMVLTIALLGIRAVRAGVAASNVLPLLSLALVTALIVVNKVGSPQFISWLAVPVVFGLLSHRIHSAPSFRMPAALTLFIAVLTHAVYPYLYHLLLAANPGMITLLTIRNLLLIALLGWAIVGLVRLSPNSSSSKESV